MGSMLKLLNGEDMKCSAMPLIGFSWFILTKKMALPNLPINLANNGNQYITTQ